MRDVFLAAVHGFVAASRDRETGASLTYRWQVLEADGPAGCFTVQLTFLPDQDYCSFEPGCHFGLMTAESWRWLRKLCMLHGLDLPPRPAVIRFVGVVSQGARCRATGRSEGFDYVELFKESEAR